MLLTDSSARGSSALTALLLLGAVALRVPELPALLDRRRLDHRADDVPHGRDPVGHDAPLLAVPLLDEDRAVALVVLARDLDRVREALHAELVEPLLGEIQVLEAPADLLAGERLVAVLPHRRADRLGREHGVDEAAVVERLADGLLLAPALALVVDELEDVLVHLEGGARRVERRTLVALRAVTRGDDVSLARGPPVAEEAVHVEAEGGRLLHADLVQDARARHEDRVGVDSPDLEPRGLLLLPWVVHRQQRQLEAELPGERLERRVRFLAVGAVVEDVDDLLALQLVRPALLLADVADDRGGLAPVGRREAEHPGEPSPVRAGRHAIAHREDRDLVNRRLRDELVGDARAVRVHHGGARRALALEPLVALDTLLRVVLGLAFLPPDLDAVDAAVALVEEHEVVHEALGDRDAARRVGAGAVDEQCAVHLLALRPRGRQQVPGYERRRERADQDRSQLHVVSSSVSGGTARDAASLSKSARAAPVHEVQRSGRR